MRFGFLGAGKMATAIARGMVELSHVAVDDIIACDTSAGAREAFMATTGISCCTPVEAWTEGLDVLVLAVKPQYVVDAVQGLPRLGARVLVVSIAAGIGLASLQRLFDTDRVVRLMPNTPLMVGKGASAYACGSAVTSADATIVESLFGSLGIVHRIDEELIDAVTALSGSGPAYVFELVQALVEGGAAAGLPYELSMSLAVQTLAGAAEMLVRGLGTPDELRDAVTSPGGTTAAGLAVLHDAGFRELVKRVVVAAQERSVELGTLTDATTRT